MGPKNRDQSALFLPTEAGPSSRAPSALVRRWKPGTLSPTVELDRLLRGIEDLLDRQVDEVVEDPGERNFRCEECNACYDCRFCVRCESCNDCTYCSDSVDCAGCTQCRRCLGCENSSYCEDSRDCTTSRYLTLCVDCADSVHCLACVGLSGAEFHVLNEKLPRREYFELLKRVQAELESRAQRGWRPEVIGLAPEEDTTQVWSDEEPAADDDASPWLDPPATDESDRLEPERSRPEPETRAPERETSRAPVESARPRAEAPARREGLRRGRRPPRRPRDP